MSATEMEVGVEMPNLVAEKLVGWQDFTLEEHMSAWAKSQMSIRKIPIDNGIFKMKQITKDTYRANYIKLATKFNSARLADKGCMAFSAVVKVVNTPKGYKFVDITV